MAKFVSQKSPFETTFKLDRVSFPTPEFESQHKLSFVNPILVLGKHHGPQNCWVNNSQGNDSCNRNCNLVAKIIL